MSVIKALVGMKARITEKASLVKKTGCWNYGSGKRPMYINCEPLGGFVRASRAMYLATFGRIPAGMFVLLTCKNKMCVNPAHMRAGPPGEKAYGRPAIDLKKRLLAKIVKVESGCWHWTGFINKDGYGMAYYSTKLMINDRVSHSQQAHRVMYIAYNGQIPSGLCVLHKCDNRRCVNPRHLYVGTHKDNSRDMVERGRNPDVRGERNPASILSAAKVRKMRQLFYDHGYTVEDLMDEYRMSASGVYNVVMKNRWRHI